MERDVMFANAVKHHVSNVRRYIDLFEHELTRKKPNVTMLQHYIESVDAHMRMASNAALSTEALGGKR